MSDTRRNSNQKRNIDWRDSSILGKISRKYESGYDPSVVALDGNSVSYGLYQFHYKSGTVQDFVNYLASQKSDPTAQEMAKRLSEHLTDANRADGNFARTWKELAKDPELGQKFSNYQHRYALLKYYVPLQKELLKYTSGGTMESYKPSEIPRAIREAIMSTSIQHGQNRAREMVNTALQQMQSRNDWETFIVSLYEQRKLQTPYTLHKRYNGELNDVMEYLRTEKNLQVPTKLVDMKNYQEQKKKDEEHKAKEKEKNRRIKSPPPAWLIRKVGVGAQAMSGAIQTVRASMSTEPVTVLEHSLSNIAHMAKYFAYRENYMNRGLSYSNSSQTTSSPSSTQSVSSNVPPNASKGQSPDNTFQDIDNTKRMSM